jgi:hypothetical protein
MRIIPAVSLMLLLLPAGAAAQTAGDACHVYVVDVAKARRALENFRETGNREADARALSAAQTLFPEFRTAVGEEELTTKHYPFPGGGMVITASVYYTDESMASHPHGDDEVHRESMLVGITVAKAALPDAISAAAGASSIVEVTHDQYTNIVRAKKYVRVRGRSYLVGIECDCMPDKREKGKAQDPRPGGVH